MKKMTFSRSIGVSIGTALFGALLLGGCSGGASSTGEQADTPIAQADEALRGRLCDGPFNFKCADGQYCDAIGKGRCPGRRRFGMCTAEPQLCPEIVQPVCGCDGKTYPNACHAGAAGVAVQHDGACETTTVACGGIAARPCPGSGKCVDDPSDNCDPAMGGADCGGICSCIETQLCVRGSHFDSNPSVCACVPDAPPPATVACGGIAARPCPGSGKCVDDPSDNCDPAKGGADCGGICSCIETQLCVRGSHFDTDPAVCACVPDATPVTCGKTTCPTGQVCCNASCGICTPPGSVCIQIACQ